MSKKRTGRTTRLVDEHIQTLFTTGEVKVYDHYDSKDSTSTTFYLIRQRLNLEHGLGWGDVEINFPYIRLKKND